MLTSDESLLSGHLRHFSEGGRLIGDRLSTLYVPTRFTVVPY